MSSWNTHSTLVAVALPSESEGLFEALGFDVLYTGVGKVNAAYALTRALTERRMQGAPVQAVLNCGSAGSRTLPRHSVAACNRFVQRDMDATPLGIPFGATPFCSHPALIEHAPLIDGMAHYTCGSGDSFEIGAPRLACDVIDMEAHALAKVCLAEGIRFGSLKFITDGADDGAGAHWQESLKLAPGALKEFVAARLLSSRTREQ